MRRELGVRILSEQAMRAEVEEFERVHDIDIDLLFQDPSHSDSLAVTRIVSIYEELQRLERGDADVDDPQWQLNIYGDDRPVAVPL